MLRPPGPKPRPLFGLLREFYRHPAEFAQRTARRYGDIAFVPLSSQNVYLITHPDFIQEVLVARQKQFKKSPVLERARVVLGEGLLTSEPPLHLRQRRLILPAFHRERMIAYGDSMAACSAQFQRRWNPGDEIDLSVDMARLTLAIVAATLFSANLDSDADEIGVAMDRLLRTSELLLLPFSHLLEKLPIPPVRRFKKARDFLDSIIYRIIRERREAGNPDTGDLLSLLMAAQDEDGSGMSDRQVRDEAITLFMAGHETTAVGVTWAWYLLSQNPRAEALFHAELDEVLGDRLPRFEDLARLPYTAALFTETMRLYPPVWGVGRRALQDVEIGGYTVPKGAIVAASTWTVHRDARWFPDPEEFRPERWLTESPTRPKFAYFPFGGGMRGCIGERFALAEGALILATIGRRWRFRLKPGHPVATEPMMTLRTRYGMRMTVEPRGA